MQTRTVEVIKSNCLFCEVEIEQPKNGSKKIFCSKSCSKKYHRRKRKQEIPIDKINCRICGADVPQKRPGSPKLYCSVRCKGVQQRRMNPVDKTKVKGKCKACGKEFRHPMIKFCSPECQRKHGWKNSYEYGKHVHVCAYCTKEFRSYFDNRTYCSRKCHGLAQRLVNAPKYPNKMKGNAVEESEIIQSNSVRFESVRLFREGYSVKAIAQALKVDNIKVQKWCQKIQSLNSTTNAHEWYETFKLKTAELTERSNNSDEVIHLICTRIDVRYNAHQLGEMLSEGLGADPHNREKYAFCSKGNTIITVIQFDGKSLVSNTRHRTRGQYVWPEEHFGGIIDVTAAEFDVIYNEEIDRKPGAKKFKKA